MKKIQSFLLVMGSLLVVLSGCTESDLEKCRGMVVDNRMECAASGEEQIKCIEKTVEGLNQCDRLYNEELSP